MMRSDPVDTRTPSTLGLRGFLPVLAFATFGLVMLAPLPGRAQIFDPYLIGMMAGPVSDGPSVLVLKKREDKFVSPDTLIIACAAGAVSGAVAHALPSLAAIASGVGAPIGVMALAGTGVFGCVVGAAAGAVAIGTQLTLALVRHGLKDAAASLPVSRPPDRPPDTGGSP